MRIKLVQLNDWCNESVATFRDSLDVTLTVLTFFQHLSQPPYMVGQIGLFNKRVRPQRLHQLFFFDEVTTSLDEEYERFESLWGERESLAVPQ
jgi:hypothetical protein